MQNSRDDPFMKFILMWQKTPCLYRREMNATSTEFTQVIEVDNRT